MRENMKEKLANIPKVDLPWLEHQLEQLAKRIVAVHTRQLRRTLAVEFVSMLSVEELVVALYVLHSNAQQGDNKAKEVLQEVALEPSAVSQLPLSILEQAYDFAERYNLVEIQGFFWKAPSTQSDVDVVGRGNQYFDIPLGVRTQAARTNDRFVLDRLCHDKNWRVIANLLDNPRITERDVIGIAARRPTRPEILELVAKHNKWASRYHVRKAIACNPDAPYALARPLLETLMKQDIMQILSMGVLADELHKEALVLLENHPLHQSSEEEDSQDMWDNIADLCASMEDAELLEMLADHEEILETEKKIHQQEQEENIDAWFSHTTQGLLDGSLPLVPVEDDEE